MTSDQHSSPIKTPKQLVVVVLLAFLVPVTLIVLVSQLVMSAERGTRDAKADESRVLERIQPVGAVTLADASAPAGNLTGVQVFDQVCKTCHGAGIAGAPKVGDHAAWGPRIAQGEKVLFQHAIGGFQGKAGVMPPKGGNGELADVEVQRAVVYMANQSGGSLKEPPAPAAATATAQGTSIPAGSVGVATAAPGASPAQAREASSAAPGAPTPPVASSAGMMATAATPPPAAAPAGSAEPAAGAKPDGKKVFETTCSVCHGAGIAGAPKFGDKAAWGPRIAQGTNVLYQHALQGFQGKSGVMPPRGGNTALGDADVKAAVDYMVAAGK